MFPGLGARAREWLCLSRFAEGQWGVAARGDITEAKPLARFSGSDVVILKAEKLGATPPQVAENTLDGRPRR